jgi:O-antigen ligase
VLYCEQIFRWESIIKLSQLKNRKKFLDLLNIILFAAVFVFAVNFSYRDLGGGGLALAHNLPTWVAYSLFIFCSVISISLFQRVRLSSFLIQHAIVVCLLLLPLLYTPYEHGAGSFHLALSVLAAFVFLIVCSQNQHQDYKVRLLQILYVSTLIQTCWGLIQYYFVFENGPLFYTAELHTTPYGTFGQKNMFTTYLSFGSLLAIYFFVRDKSKSLPLLIFTVVVLLLNAHLSMLAEAKSGRVIALIAITMYLGFCYFYHKVKLFSVLMILAVFTASFMPKQWFDVRPNQEIDAPLGINSIGVRPSMYKIGVDIVSENPLFGIGVGNLNREFAERKAREQESGFAQYEMPGVSHIHNEPLQWMIELGIVSGVAFIFLFGIWIRGLVKGELDPSILLLSLPLIGHSLLELPVRHSAVYLLAFVCVIALSYRGKTRLVTLSSAMSYLLAFMSALASVLVIFYMWLLFNSMNNLIAYHDSKRLDEKKLYDVVTGPIFETVYEHERFQWIVRKNIVRGTLTNEIIDAYIEFLESIRKNKPEAVIYPQLTQLYIMQKSPEMAKEIIEEGKLFFPWDEGINAAYADLHKDSPAH